MDSNNTAVTSLIILGGAGLAAYLIYNSMKDKPSELSTLPDVIPPVFGAAAGQGAGGQGAAAPPAYTSSTLVNALVVRLRNVTQNATGNILGSTSNTRCNTYKDYFNTGTNDFIAIWNEYKNRYGTTIREDMDATWNSGCSFWDTDWDESLYDRFNTLNLF